MIFISRIFDIKEWWEFISKKRPLDFSAADSFEGKNLQRGTAPDTGKRRVLIKIWRRNTLETRAISLNNAFKSRKLLRVKKEGRRIAPGPL